jgi:stalled ribosome alternative rescue factor ArfA
MFSWHKFSSQGISSKFEGKDELQISVIRASGTSSVGRVLAGPIFRQVLEKKTQGKG